MSTNRDDAIRLVARQICIMNGQIWNNIPLKQQDRYITHAGNMVATVERKQFSFRWDHPAEKLSAASAYGYSNG